MSDLSITPTQLEDLLKRTMPAKLPVLIKGRPGIGKSDIVAKAAAAANAAEMFVDAKDKARYTESGGGMELIISHPVISDPTDFKGLPMMDGHGGATFMPFGELKRLLEATKPTVFFLDDLGQAPPLVQAACMQLLLARQINGIPVSPFVSFVAATNRKGDRAAVSGVLEPVKSRFASIVELDTKVDDWVRWALHADVPTEVIGFVRFRPLSIEVYESSADLVNSSSPRTMAMAGKLLNMGLPEGIELAALSGAVGQGVATELVAFLRTFRSLPSIESILMEPVKTPVPKDSSAKYAVTALIARHASVANFDTLMKYVGRLPPEFQVLAVRDSIGACNEVARTRAMTAWISENQSIMI